jgi:hypothetical protein
MLKFSLTLITRSGRISIGRALYLYQFLGGFLGIEQRKFAFPLLSKGVMRLRRYGVFDAL